MSWDRIKHRLILMEIAVVNSVLIPTIITVVSLVLLGIVVTAIVLTPCDVRCKLNNALERINVLERVNGGST